MKKEVQIGLVAIIAIAVAYYGFSFLLGKQILRKGTQFYALYPSSGGIAIDNHVKLNGISVGKVNKVSLSDKKDGSVLVGFYIDHDNAAVTDSTIAKVASLDLFGTMAVILQNTRAGNVLGDGDTVMSEVEGDLKSAVDERLRPLEEKTNALIGSMDSLVSSIQIILDEDTRKNLHSSFKSINKSLKVFERTAGTLDASVEKETKRFDSILYNINSITANLNNNNERIDNVLKNFSDISDSLAKADITGTFDKAGKTLENVAVVMEKIEKGEGTMGMLINNDSLYNNLNESSAELDKLLEDMRVNPNRYVHFSVFGRKEKSAEKPKKKER